MPCQAQKTAPRGPLWALHATEDPISRALLQTFQTVSLGTWVNIVEVNAPGAISVVLRSRLKPYGDDVAVAVGVAVEVVVSSSRVVLGRGVCSVVVAG